MLCLRFLCYTEESILAVCCGFCLVLVFFGFFWFFKEIDQIGELKVNFLSLAAI